MNRLYVQARLKLGSARSDDDLGAIHTYSRVLLHTLKRTEQNRSYEHQQLFVRGWELKIDKVTS